LGNLDIEVERASPLYPLLASPAIRPTVSFCRRLQIGVPFRAFRREPLFDPGKNPLEVHLVVRGFPCQLGFLLWCSAAVCREIRL